jgi:predicted nucleic acid-binding protein
VTRALLDTSVLIGADPVGDDVEAAISVASLAELHFGVVAAADPDERSRRTARLGIVESTFDPLPIDDAVAREWGRLAGAVAERGGAVRRRHVDLAIAATANVNGLLLLTHDLADLEIVRDLVDARQP